MILPCELTMMGFGWLLSSKCHPGCEAFLWHTQPFFFDRTWLSPFFPLCCLRATKVAPSVSEISEKTNLSAFRNITKNEISNNANQTFNAEVELGHRPRTCRMQSIYGRVPVCCTVSIFLVHCCAHHHEAEYHRSEHKLQYLLLITSGDVIAVKVPVNQKEGVQQALT